MRNAIVLAGVLGFSLPLFACGLQPDPPLEIPQSAYGGMGDIMAHCMQYASESTCLRQTWGGDGDGGFQ
jgi:hypothetical protein